MLFWAILGAVTYRFRGVGNQWVGTRLARLPWCLVLTLAAYSVLPNKMLLDLPALFILSYVGVMFGYFGGQFDLALGSNRNYANYLILTIKGATIALPVCLYIGNYYAIFAGSLFFVYYLFGLSFSDKNFPVIGDLLLGSAILSGIVMMG